MQNFSSLACLEEGEKFAVVGWWGGGVVVGWWDGGPDQGSA